MKYLFETNSRRQRRAMMRNGLAMLVAVVAVAALAGFALANRSEAEVATPRAAQDEASGAALTQTAERQEAQELAASPYDLSAVEPVMQYPAYPSGCELAALTGVLNALGHEVDMFDIVNGPYVPYDYAWTTFDAEYYFGSPYAEGGAFPPAVVAAANAYLEEQGASQRAHELACAMRDDVMRLMESGYPVLAWVTISYGYPTFDGTVFSGAYRWYTNEHCVVAYGVQDGDVLVSDSVNGAIEVPTDYFFEPWEDRGSMAVVVE